MGTVLQNRTLRSADTVSIEDPERKKRAARSSSSSRPPGAGSKMGRRQAQRKSVPPQHALPVPERNGEQKPQQRRKQKPRTPSTKRVTTRHSSQGTSEAESASRHHDRGSRHLPAFPSHRLPCPRGSQDSHAEGDTDTDLSESERLPVSPCSRVPPQLRLRPELIEAEDRASCRPGTNNPGSSGFPDFLPPPFNSWSLGQLAVFYNTEGRGAPRPRPVGPLERYMERMLQLEWRQIRTVQEEGGTPALSDGVYGCHRAAGAASSRLSSPKCILHCQRSFPLTFLSSLASHCALLSGCACTLCRIRYTACCTTSSSSSPCCRSTRQSRLSPTPERGGRGVASLPKRSYSESRVHSADRGPASRAHRFGSPTPTNSHLRRMQASGNIRNPDAKPQASARDSRVGDLLGARGGVPDYRPGGFRRRGGSEQRRGGVEGQRGAVEKRRSGSECRRGEAERRRAAELREREITPDAVDAIMDNLPACKNYPTNRANRPKQVVFVT